MISDELIEGVIPSSIEEKSTAVRVVSRFARRAVPLNAMLIAAARRDNFDRDRAGDWADWCAENAGVTKADKRCHLDSIGRMLLSIQAQKRYAKVFNLLYELDSEKLLCLTRLVKPGFGGADDDATDVISFVTQYQVETMSRDALRCKIKRWCLGTGAIDREEAEKERPVQQELPGFERSLDLIHDLQPDTARPMIKSRNTAEKAMYGGAILLDGALHFAGNTGDMDPGDLDALKAKLLDMVDAIDRIQSAAAEKQVAAEPEDMPEDPGSETPETPAADVAADIAAEPEEVAAEVAAEPETIAAAATEKQRGLRKSASREGLPQRQSRPKSRVAAKGMGFDFDIAAAMKNAVGKEANPPPPLK